jgi:hypothetical protein
LLLPFDLTDPEPLVLRFEQDFRSVQAVKDGRGVFPRYFYNVSAHAWEVDMFSIQPTFVDQDSRSTWMEGSELAQVVNDRIDDNP